jgi:hypothetical protein
MAKRTMYIYATVKLTVECEDDAQYMNDFDMEEELVNVESNMDYQFEYNQDGMKIVDSTVVSTSYNIPDSPAFFADEV